MAIPVLLEFICIRFLLPKTTGGLRLFMSVAKRKYANESKYIFHCIKTKNKTQLKNINLKTVSSFCC